MAKRGGSRKSQFSSGILKFFIFVILVGSVIFLVYAQTVRFFEQSPIFRVKEVVLAPSLKFIEPRYLYRLKGQSIFLVNLEMVHRSLRDRYPEVDALRIVRKFPDRIYIAANKREPVAAVVLGTRQFLLDREGVVVAPGPAVGLKIPTIQGVRRASRVSFGSSLNSAEIDAALEIINLFQNNPDLRPFAIQSVDVANLAKVQFLINGNLQIIIDLENAEQKIAKLGIMLTEGRLNWADISYIDLRFQEPILGKKMLDLKTTNPR